MGNMFQFRGSTFSPRVVDCRGRRLHGKLGTAKLHGMSEYTCFMMQFGARGPRLVRRMESNS